MVNHGKLGKYCKNGIKKREDVRIFERKESGHSHCTEREVVEDVTKGEGL